MRVFPIFQTTGTTPSYFDDAKGYQDALDAATAASGLGFPRHTTIYFAVDCDPTGEQIASHVIPHFQGIKRAMTLLGNKYGIGVYGTRNVCCRLEAMSLAELSFVAGMSTGYSGNLGFSLPGNWAFDQIKTLTVGAGLGAIEIDNDIASGRDIGCGTVLSVPLDGLPDTLLDISQYAAVVQEISDFCENVVSNKAFLVHDDAASCVSAVLSYDILITQAANQWGVRKALIQAVAFWEYWKQTYADNVADTFVNSTYQYYEAREAWEEHPESGPPPIPPLVIYEDSSTGFAQVFAATGIRAHNWAVHNGYLNGPTLDPSDWHHVWNMWYSLSSDDQYNLSMIPVVLMEGADNVGVANIPRRVFTDEEIIRILARYNGTGVKAHDYGYELKEVYDIFESFNAALRV